MSNPTAKRKKFYCAAVYTSDAYALDVTDAIVAAGTEPAWQDAEIFKNSFLQNQSMQMAMHCGRSISAHLTPSCPPTGTYPR